MHALSQVVHTLRDLPRSRERYAVFSIIPSYALFPGLSSVCLTCKHGGHPQHMKVRACVTACCAHWQYPGCRNGSKKLATTCAPTAVDVRARPTARFYELCVCALSLVELHRFRREKSMSRSVRD